MGQLQEVTEEIVGLGYQLLFVSPDRPEKIRELKQNTDVEFTLLSDSGMEAAIALGRSRL